MSTADEVFILETALKVMTRALDDLAGKCMDENGRPKAPDMRSLMTARGYLPASSKHSLKAGKP